MDTENKNRTLPISMLLQNQNSPITKLYKKSLTIYTIDKKLKEILQPSLKQHFQLANIDGDVATLLANSAAWATHLRYNIPAILNALNDQLHFISVKTIRIKVKKPLFDHTVANKKPNTLSKKSAQFLVVAANSFDDPEIQNCIRKLSKH